MPGNLTEGIKSLRGMKHVDDTKVFVNEERANILRHKSWMHLTKSIDVLWSVWP